MTISKPPAGGADGPSRDNGSYRPDENAYEPGSRPSSAPPDSYVQEKDQGTPDLLARSSPPGLALLLTEPRLSQSAINDKLAILCETIAQDLQRPDPFGLEKTNDSRIIAFAFDYIRNNFSPEKTAAGRPPTDKLIADALRHGFREVHDKAADRNNSEIAHLIPGFAHFIRANALALNLVGIRPRAKHLGGTSPMYSSSASITTPADESSADLPGGMRALLADRLPREPENFARLEEQFESATGYPFSRFLLWGTIRARPGEMNARIWETLISQSTSQEELAALLLSHPEKNITVAEVWQKTVERARVVAGLDTFAARYVPGNITEADWARYVNARISAGHPEDVTVEPRTGEAVSAMLPAFLFLRSHGIDLDVVSYLSAIYPLFGELAREAQNRSSDGSMRIEVPLSVLGENFSLKDLTYEAWARRIEQRAFPTLVLKQTLAQHANGLHNPVYRNVERYARPLAASVGATPERERNIYLFLAALPRVAEVLYHTTAIYGPYGETLSAPISGTSFGPVIHIISDEARYPTGYRAPTGSPRKSLELDVRRGAYRAMLGLSDNHLAQLEEVEALLHPHFTFSYADGRETSLAELVQRHESFVRRIDEFDRRLLDAASKKDVDVIEINEFYRDLRQMTEDIFFFVRVRGQMPSALGTLPFFASVRMEGRRIFANDSAILFLNDIGMKAAEEEWDKGRTNAVMLMRVYAWHALNRGLLSPEKAGDAAAVAAATRVLLISDQPGWQQAALDFVGMEREQTTISLRDTVGDVLYQRRAKHSEIVAMLRNIIRHDPAPILAMDEPIEPLIARRAVESYVALYPKERDVDEGVPIDPALVRIFVDLEAAEYQNPHRELAALQALDTLERYNERRGVPAMVIEKSGAALQAQGLMQQRFMRFVFEWSSRHTDWRDSYNRDSVWNALWMLRDRIISGEIVDEGDIHSALVDSSRGVERGGTEASLLAHILARQQHDIKTFSELITAPWLGLTSFVRERFVARYITDEALEDFAARHASQRFTSVAPVDTDAIVAEALGDAFLPHLDITEKMAGFYRTLVGRWFAWADEQLAGRVEEGFVAIDTIAEDLDNLPATVEVLMQRAADLAGAAGFEELSDAEQKLRLLREQNGGPSTGETLLTAAERTFRERIIPERNTRLAHKAQEIATLTSSLEIRLNMMAREVAEHLERSARVFTGSVDVSNMDERAVAALLASAQASFNTLSDIQTEHARLANYPGTAACIAWELGHGEGTVRVMRENMIKAETNIRNALDNIAEAHAAARSRHSELKRLREASVMEQRAVEAQGAAEAVISELKFSIKDFEALLRNEIASYEAEAERLKQTFTSSRFTDANAFLSVAQVADGLISYRGSIIAKLDAIQARISDQIEERGDSTEPRSTLAAQRIVNVMYGTDNSQWRNLAGTAERLSSAIHNADVLLNEIKALKYRMDTAVEQLCSAIDDAERTLPQGPMAGLGIPSQTVPEPSDDDHRFTTEVSEPNSHIKAQNILKPILFGRILSLRGESRLVTQHQAGVIDGWLRAARQNSLSIRDAFGNTIELTKGERGIRLESNTELSDGHPLSALVNTLGLAVSEKSAEAQIIALIARECLKWERPDELLLDLFATIATRPLAIDALAAREIIRSWALSRRQRIIAVLKKPAERFFISRASDAKGPRAIQEVRVRPDKYTATEHARLAQRFAGQLESPDRKDMQPLRLEMIRLMYRIYSDPALMDLGWIASISMDPSSPLHQMLCGTLQTIARSQAQPVIAPLQELHTLQNEVRAAYRKLMQPGAAPYAPGGVSIEPWLTDSAEPSTEGVMWQVYLPIQRLYTIAPEFWMMDEEDTNSILQRLVECADSICGKIDPQEKPVKYMLGFVTKHPEFAGTISLLSLLLDHLPEKIRYESILKFFSMENGPWNNPTAAAEFIGSSHATLAPEDAFVMRLTDPQTLAALRKAMQKPLPRQTGPSIAVVFLGDERPWLPRPEILPPSDLVTVQSFSGRELMTYIQRKLAETRLLDSLQKSGAIETNICVWLEREQVHAEVGDPAIIFVGSESAKQCFGRMMLILEKADPTLGLTKAFRGLYMKYMEQAPCDDDLLRFAYGYLVEHRDQIIAAAKAIQYEKKTWGSGTGSVPPQAPAPSSAASGALPPAAALSVGVETHDVRLSGPQDDALHAETPGEDQPYSPENPLAISSANFFLLSSMRAR